MPDVVVGDAVVRALTAVGKRLLAAVAVVFGAASLGFVALQLLPGDPVDWLLGPNMTASPDLRARVRADYGFDRPVFEQYLSYLNTVLHGQLGTSYQLQQPVTTLIANQLAPTAELAVTALVLALAIAIAAAVATAGRRPRLRAGVSTAELVVTSAPQYWVGILLLTGFSFQLRVFPVAGAQTPAALVLPAITLALSIAGVLSQVLREGLEAALTQPFIVTARARGASLSAVRLRHALRHAAAPLLTLTGWLTGTLLGGVVPVETVFGRPGIGSLVLQAVTSRDMPVVMGVILLSAVVFVVISTLVDLLQLALDPRIRTNGDRP
ncbi:ABC transporter permease [Nocardia macrotermitis]|uniref:Glutathione transport system permease protein GsiC n=1 Tax=Nocardia macrotermitis TaxID=2585198 RepID=A0A7K0D3I0_9NOCA|nr:ABC transporter permease [Nocardia macrotermitis]MQY20191.1 Glutathione transport system permease protein GsiC [Nocardia macrotermitis]